MFLNRARQFQRHFISANLNNRKLFECRSFCWGHGLPSKGGMASHRKVHVDSEKQLGMAPLRNIQNREPLLDGHAVLVDAQLFCFCPGEVWPPFFVGSLGPLFGPGPPGDDRKANVFKFSYARICSADDPDLPPSTKPTSAGKVALPNWQSSICQFNWRKTYFAAGNTRFAIN